MHGTGGEPGWPGEEQRRGVGRRLGPVPVVVPADGELELDDAEQVGKGDGDEAERDLELQRRGNAELRQQPASRAADRLRGGERAEGVGRAGGARRPHHLRLASAGRERSQADTLQVRPYSYSRYFHAIYDLDLIMES